MVDINAISINDATNLTMWSTIYQVIYQANSILEGVEGSPLFATLKRQLRGEALFIRAVSHFNLANLYGDVPLILTTSVTENSVAGRTPKADVYLQIETDLTTAVTLLATGYDQAFTVPAPGPTNGRPMPCWRGCICTQENMSHPAQSRPG